MPPSRRRLTHKHFRLDQTKIRKAQKLLGAKTETETMDRALDELIAERERHRRTWAAIDRFVRSGAQVQDVSGALGGR